jgi:hypothetical protein
MVPEIPQELIDATIDCLTDPEDLYRCALVSQSWRPRAQSHIFRVVSLGIGLQGGSAPGIMEIPSLGTDFDNFQCFRDLLQGSPHLALHIRTLNLGLPPLQSELITSIDHPTLDPASWQVIEDSVVEFLPLLQGLDSLGLFPCGQNTHTFHLQPRVFSAFRDLSIKSLKFSRWSFADSSALSSFDSNPPSSLQFIECDFQMPLMPLHLAPFSTHLTALELHHCEGLSILFQSPVPGRDQIDFLTIGISYSPETALLVCRTLSHIAWSVGQGLTVVFDAGGHLLSGVLIGIAYF